MSIFDKIKKFFEGDNEPEAEKVSINISELPAKIKSLGSNRQALDQRLKEQIKERISLFEKESENLIKSLTGVDISKRKEYDKIKFVVQENLNLYSAQFSKLIKDIAKIEEPDSFDCLNKIFKVINEFFKLSNPSYQKATYLVGKEMAAIKGEIKRFAEDINTIAKENKLEEAKMIDKISKLFNEFNMLNSLINRGIPNEIEKLNLKIKEYDYKKKGNESEIEYMKESEDYTKDRKKIEDYQKNQNLLDEEIEDIRKKIDFKALAGMFHPDKKKADIIKNYSNDFKSSLKADENMKIVEMVKSSQNIDISSLKQLRDQLVYSDSPIVLETEVKISFLLSKLKMIESEKAAAESAIVEENKKQDRLTKKKEKILSELKELLATLNVIVN